MAPQKAMSQKKKSYLQEECEKNGNGYKKLLQIF